MVFWKTEYIISYINGCLPDYINWLEVTVFYYIIFIIIIIVLLPGHMCPGSAVIVVSI